MKTSKAIKDMMKSEAACCRTGDLVAKSVFYLTQGLNSMGNVTTKGAFFKKGTVDVTLQSLWRDMKTGSMMMDRLITILQHKN